MFNVGEKVRRIEYRETVGATVLQIDNSYVLIGYDEGGSGWWPIECLELDITTD